MKVPALCELPDNIVVAELSSFLRVSRPHVYKLLEGKVTGVPPLESIRVGRRTIIRKESLLDWLTRAEQASAKTWYDPPRQELMPCSFSEVTKNARTKTVSKG